MVTVKKNLAAGAAAAAKVGSDRASASREPAKRWLPFVRLCLMRALPFDLKSDRTNAFPYSTLSIQGLSV